jgi:hypothetical protein
MATQVIERIRAIGPYLVLELFMPGGTILALLLFMCRRKAGVARLPDEANTPAMSIAMPQGTSLAANP